MTPGIVTQFGSPPYRIHQLNDIVGVTFGEVWNGAATIALDGRKLRVIGLTELKKNKSATGRKRGEENVRPLNASLREINA